jgi:hypothetical protein
MFSWGIEKVDFTRLPERLTACDTVEEKPCDVLNPSPPLSKKKKKKHSDLTSRIAHLTAYISINSRL